MLILSKQAGAELVTSRELLDTVEVSSLDPRDLKLHFRFTFSSAKDLLLMLKHSFETKAELGRMTARELTRAFQDDTRGDAKSIVLRYYEYYSEQQEKFDAYCTKGLEEFVAILKKDDTALNDASARLTAAMEGQRWLATIRYQAVLQLMSDFKETDGTAQNCEQLIAKLENLNLEFQPKTVANTIEKPQPKL